MLAWLAVPAVGSEFAAGSGLLGGVCRSFQVSGSFRRDRTWSDVGKSASKIEVTAALRRERGSGSHRGALSAP